MIAGDTGIEETVVAIVRAAEDPHWFAAETVILPPLIPTFTVIEFVVEFPVHPAGNVQLYDAAPATGATEYVCVLP